MRFGLGDRGRNRVVGRRGDDLSRAVAAFDDVHRVDDPAFFRFLDPLIERMSPRWTVALTARTEPPLALRQEREAVGSPDEHAVGAERYRAGVKPVVATRARGHGYAVPRGIAFVTARGLSRNVLST